MDLGVTSYTDKIAGAVITALIGLVVWLVQRRLEPSTRLRYWSPHDFIFQVPGPGQVPAQQASAQQAQAQQAQAQQAQAQQAQAQQAQAQQAQPQQAQPQQAQPQQAAVQQSIVVRTSTLTVQNLGRKLAENVQIIHADRPDHFQMHPRRHYSETIAPDGTHVITIESLGPREVIQVQLLSYVHNPTLVGVRSKEGEAKALAFQIQRVVPRWLLVLLMICTFIGAIGIVYWLVLAAIFISRANGML